MVIPEVEGSLVYSSRGDILTLGLWVSDLQSEFMVLKATHCLLASSKSQEGSASEGSTASL